MSPPAIRFARPEDGPGYLRLVRELAEFEKLDPPSPEAERRLLEDAFGKDPKYELLVALAGREVVAYAIVLRTYSSFLAKPTLYLEDLYLSPGHRGSGLAERMMGTLAQLALDRGWGRLEGIVLTWNDRARRFYERTGAKELRDWYFFRYDEAALEALAEKGGGPA
ncbi:MAG TPA: GNAT family N-acetyltransferase [Candidatus Thermoplasmatota archaeon]|nr:GNAT family N-acetyltransferase [Candidatus Thermoplasmatota archaeon]